MIIWLAHTQETGEAALSGIFEVNCEMGELRHHHWQVQVDT